VNLQITKVLTGLMLPVLISAVSVYPSVASSTSNLKSQPILLSQATQAGELAGVINSINGETVEFAQSGGPTRNITIPQQDIQRLNLQAGARIAVRLNAQGVATSVRVLRPIRGLW
jgi:Golgi nucleoside diphosphatase